jgi:integrase
MKKADRGLYQRGNIWYIRFADQKGEIQRESSGSTNKSVAKQFLAVRKAEVFQGKFEKVQKKEKVLFKDYAQVFLRWAKLHRKVNTFKRYERSITQLLKHFGPIFLNDIKRQNIEEFKDKRKKSVSGSTINRDLACLRKLFNNAIADEFIDLNPLFKTEFFKEPKKSVNFLSEEEARRLIKSCDNEVTKSFVVIGLNTGMRLSEILSLKWVQINFEDNLITLKDTKNNKEDTIPMNDTLVEYLSSLKIKENYVISQDDGSRCINFRKHWTRVVKIAKLPHCTPHYLRHTWATMLVRAGVDLLTLKELGRWSDLTLVERYAHIDDKHRIRDINKLNSVFQTDTSSDTVGNSAKNTDS